MVPHSTYEILGAKVLAGILQMVFIFLAFFITGVVTVTVTAASEGSLGELLRGLGRFFRRGYPQQCRLGRILWSLPAAPDQLD